MKILIVDDEKLARERLKDLVMEIDSRHQCREAENGLAALQSVAVEQADIILLDIRMPVMDGLETAYHLAALDPSPAVVFTTAYQDHAFDAFDAEVVDYLLKPIRSERLQLALARAQIINRARIASLREKEPSIKSRSHLSATSQGKIELISIEEIRYLKAEQKYITVGWPGRETLIDESLKTLEAEFPDQFLRIHRNALVAIAFIEALVKDKDGGFFIQLNDVPEQLLISRRHLSGVRQALKTLSS